MTVSHFAGAVVRPKCRAGTWQAGGMDRRRVLTAMAVSLPGLGLAAAGITHPHFLTVESAQKWWSLHVWLLPLFPLVPAALLVLIRGENSAVAWAARIAGFAFAVGYTALDAIDGIAAGLAVDVTNAPQDVITGRMFEIGDRLGRAGIWCLLISLALTCVALWPRHRWWTAPGAVVFAFGCRLFYLHHIFSPRGAWGMVAIAAGTALLASAPLHRPGHRAVADAN
jgi:hypothetical protein